MLMNEREFVSEFGHYWTTDLQRYLLVRSKKAPLDLTRYLLYDTVDRVAVVVEEEEILVEIVKRMKAAGAVETDGLPVGEGGHCRGPWRSNGENETENRP
jgi:hypothetical protein